MNKFWAFIERHPVVTLAFIAPLFSNLVTGITPPVMYFHPFNILLELLPVSLAAVLARELAVRWKSGWKGLLLLGLAFGILSTVFFNRDIFSSVYASSENAIVGDYVWNINWQRGIQFIQIIGLFGIIIPVMFVEILSPATKGKPWLNTAGLGICIGGVAAKLTNNFLMKSDTAIPPVQAILFGAVVLLCIAGALVLKEKKSEAEGPQKNHNAVNAVIGVLIVALPVLNDFDWNVGPAALIYIAAVNLAALVILYLINNRFRNLPDFAVFYFISGAVIFITVMQLYKDYTGKFQGYLIIILFILLLFHLVRMRLKARNR